MLVRTKKGNQMPMKYSVILIFYFFCFQLGYSQEPSASIYEGTGYCSGTNIPEVEKCALEEARKDALQKAGTYILATAKVDMFQLKEEEINSFAGGFVKVLEKKVQTDYDPQMHAVKSTANIKAEIENKKILEGIKSIIQSNSSLSKLDSPLKFEFALYGRKRMPDGQFAQVLVNENTGLNSGDQFQISFKTNQDCYIYVINIDSHGNIFPAFPNEERGIVNNLLKAEEEYILPSEDLYYELDSKPGVETIYFMGSLEPMEDMKFILGNLENLGRDNLALRGLLEARSAARAIAKIIEGPGGENITQQARKLLEGYGSLVLKVSFNHY